MAKPNYQYEKRQRDLAKKLKKEEKQRQKLAGKTTADAGTDQPGAPAAEEGSTPSSPESDSASEE